MRLPTEEIDTSVPSEVQGVWMNNKNITLQSYTAEYSRWILISNHNKADERSEVALG